VLTERCSSSCAWGQLLPITTILHCFVLLISLTLAICHVITGAAQAVFWAVHTPTAAGYYSGQNHKPWQLRRSNQQGCTCYGDSARDTLRLE
jgi:hypothetical protein